MYRFTFISIFIYNAIISPAYGNCDQDLQSSPTLTSTPQANIEEFAQDLTQECATPACEPQKMSQWLFKNLINDRGRAYAAISAVMIGSSSLAAFLSSLVSQESPALSYFVATFLSQVSTLGFVVVGAPLWEPLQSKIRAMAYKVTGQHQEQKTTNSFLDRQYFATNKILTLNEQMSRNITHYYTLALRQTFLEAKKLALREEDDYVAAQIAETAVRLRAWFPDVNPQGKEVLFAIHKAFTEFIDQPQKYIPLVLEHIRQMDTENDYSETVTAWLTLK
ncbi:MAG: hypothetical protein KDD40_09925 [Bdellovibrionales bacterium]|nr:hypothetical protein [Bdellovibrionales bacterium]